MDPVGAGVHPRPPRRQRHEGAGTVVETGAGVTELKVGDRVALETGALLEAAGGPVGLVVAHLARLMGAAHVIVVEPNPYRRTQAEKLGATAMPPGPEVIERCRELTGRRGGFDVAFECSGAPTALTTLFDALRNEATLVTVGHPSRPAELNIAATINEKGITLRGILGRRLCDTWEQTMLLLDSGRLDLDWLITHRKPLSQIDEAVDLRTGEACKVLLVPSLPDPS